MATPRFSASGSSVSVASSATRDRSTGSGAKDRWSVAAEQEQRFGEVDRSGVDGVEAVDELAVVAVRILAGDFEQRLRDRQRGAQLVGGVGGEPLLLGDVGFEPLEHGVERVGELAELVFSAGEPDPVRERPVRRQACGVGDASQRGEHAAGEKPPSHEAERQQERRHCGCLRSERAHEVVAAGTWRCPRALAQHQPLRIAAGLRWVGYVTQQEHPDDREQQGTGQHDEPGVAEGELETDAQTRRPIHAPLPRACRLRERRCGNRRRPRSR